MRSFSAISPAAENEQRRRNLFLTKSDCYLAPKVRNDVVIRRSDIQAQQVDRTPDRCIRSASNNVVELDLCLQPLCRRCPKRSEQQPEIASSWLSPLKRDIGTTTFAITLSPNFLATT